MTKYIAFLRGINVGGKNIIKMETLKKSFESMGFKNVKTYIQSGNVLFDSGSNNQKNITGKIEKALLNEYGSEIKIMLRTFSEIESLVNLNPFIEIKPNKNLIFYVCFYAEELNLKPKLPIVLEKEACEIIAVENRNILIVSKKMKNGRSGFPNNFIEKEFGKTFTVRNWNTVQKIIELK